MGKTVRFVCMMCAAVLCAASIAKAEGVLPYPGSTPTPTPAPAATAMAEKAKATSTPKATKKPKATRKPKATPTPKPITTADIKKSLLAYMNSSRKEWGAKPLKRDDTLDAAAQVRAQELTQKFSHTRPDGTLCLTVSKKASGENIASLSVNPQLDSADKLAKAIHESWMSSRAHRDNVIHAEFKIAGIGYLLVDDLMYWVQLFGY